MRRLVGLVTLVVSLGALAWLAPWAFAAPQTSVTATGWWWRAQSGIGPQLPPPPNTAEGDLMVGADPSGANAVAAVAATLAEGRINPILTLNLKPDGDTGGSGASLLACHAGSAWSSAEAGVWDAKPAADCSVSVAGIRSETGSSWTFPVGPLQFGDQLNVVIVPAADDDGAIATFSLVFDGPGASNIETSPGTPPATVPPATTPTAPPTTQPVTVGTADPVVAPPVAPPPEPVQIAQPALPPADQGVTATAPRIVTPTTPLPAPEPASRTAARLGGLVAVVAALGGAYLVADGRLPFGSPAASPDHPVDGGLGRHRRPRDAEPSPIG